MVRPHWPIVNEALRGALARVSLTRLAEVQPGLVQTGMAETAQ
jgi:hypothetical protein